MSKQFVTIEKLQSLYSSEQMLHTQALRPIGTIMLQAADASSQALHACRLELETAHDAKERAINSHNTAELVIQGLQKKLETSTATLNEQVALLQQKHQDAETKLHVSQQQQHGTDSALAAAQQNVKEVESQLAAALQKQNTAESSLAAAQQRLRDAEAKLQGALQQQQGTESKLSSVQQKLETTESAYAKLVASSSARGASVDKLSSELADAKTKVCSDIGSPHRAASSECDVVHLLA
jgi:chromosome segregation ATPase